MKSGDSLFRESLRPEEKSVSTEKSIIRGDNPPSFYYEDKDKWMKSKFAGAIKDREF